MIKSKHKRNKILPLTLLLFDKEINLSPMIAKTKWDFLHSLTAFKLSYNYFMNLILKSSITEFNK
jgi:hypothetical protein